MSDLFSEVSKDLKDDGFVTGQIPIRTSSFPKDGKSPFTSESKENKNGSILQKPNNERDSVLSKAQEGIDYQLILEIAEAKANILTGHTIEITVREKSDIGEIDLESTARFYNMLKQSNYVKLLWNAAYNKSLNGSYVLTADVYNGEARLGGGYGAVKPSKAYADIMSVGVLKDVFSLKGAKVRYYENYYITKDGKVKVFRTHSFDSSGSGDSGITGVEGANQKERLATDEEVEKTLFKNNFQKTYTYKNLKQVPCWEITNKNERQPDIKGLESFLEAYVYNWFAFLNELKRNKTKYIFKRDVLGRTNGKTIEKASEDEKTALEDTVFHVNNAIISPSLTNNQMPWEIFVGDPKLDTYILEHYKLRHDILNFCGVLDRTDSQGVHNKHNQEVSMDFSRNFQIINREITEYQDDLARMLTHLMRVDIDSLGNGDKYPKNPYVDVVIRANDVTDKAQLHKIMYERVEMGISTIADYIAVVDNIPIHKAMAKGKGAFTERVNILEQLNVPFLGQGKISMRVTSPDEIIGKRLENQALQQQIKNDSEQSSETSKSDTKKTSTKGKSKKVGLNTGASSLSAGKRAKGRDITDGRSIAANYKNPRQGA